SPDGRKIASLTTHATGPMAKYAAALTGLPSALGFPVHPGKEVQKRYSQQWQRKIEAARQEVEKLEKFVLRSRLRVWDLVSGQELRGTQVSVDYPSPSFLPISDAWFTPDGARLTALFQPAEPVRKDWVWGGSRVSTWDVSTGQETGSFTRDDVLVNQ